MFKIKGKLQFVSVNTHYLAALYNADNEVQYSSSGYENKKYLGVIVNQDDFRYVIPLTSAKEKHKSYKNIGDSYLLLYENADYCEMRSNDIWMRYKDSKGNETNNVKHILALLDCRKMIPVIDGFYEGVDFTSSDDDSEDDAKYKDLLEKEYSFCVTNKEKILKKANKIYDKRKNQGKRIPRCCDFKVLEQVAISYTEMGNPHVIVKNSVK